jgi:DNA recombination protein RmuC
MDVALFIVGLLVGLAIAGALLARRAARAEGAAAALQAELATAERHAAETLGREQAAYERQVADLQRATEEKLRLVASGREDFAKEMRAISAGVLRQATEQLTAVAGQAREADRQTAVTELTKRTEEIKRSLDPISQHLRRVQEEVGALERERRQTQGAVDQMFRTVTDEVGRLRTETGTLVSALKRPNVRGSWGEMQLRNCVEAANMTSHVDFHDQRTIDGGDEGRLRPDMTVHLPAGNDVVVDSKVPLDAYLAALEAPEGEREGHLDRHARQLRTHLDTLASKAYHAQFAESPPFVICFIPNEAIYCAALDRDASLLGHAAGKNVLIATPTTLMALLHAVCYGWRQETIEASAREIADAARELHKRCANFLEPFAKLGRQLTSATNAYNEATGSLEARVLPQLRRIEEAGAGSERLLAAPRALDTPPRLVTAPELHMDPGDAEPPARDAA